MSDEMKYSKGEEITNAILHGIGLGLAIAALVILIVFANHYGNTWHIIGFTVYGSTLIILYLSSTLYHSFPAGKLKRIFRIFDHSSIFLLIAGTYTPLTLIALQGTLGWTFFCIVWSLAILGIIFKIFWINRFKLFSTVLYILMGWLIIIAIKPLLTALNNKSIIFLIIGGGFYTVGTIFYSCRRIKYNHAIWHLFVLAGSICHFFTIFYIL
ncbi:PAQR family membrane homeostasis protein TrhA [Iocasia frigidifontis]|nr:hemolysin III family protein [Iocasia fonsfrigidae]